MKSLGNVVKIKGEVINIPIFKKECNNVSKEKLSFIVKCPTPTKHYALIPVTLWGKLAIEHRDRITKGNTIRIEGSIGTWSFLDANKKKNKQWAVNANNINILSQRKKEN